MYLLCAICSSHVEFYTYLSLNKNISQYSAHIYLFILIISFNDYGENVFLVLQNLIIILLMWRYTRISVLHRFVMTILFILFWCISCKLPLNTGPLSECWTYLKQSSFIQNKSLLTSIISDAYSSSSSSLVTLHHPCRLLKPSQQLLLQSTIPLIFMSRIPQIFSNFQNGHTGVQSFVTLFMNSFGSFIRIFTTLQATTTIDQNALFIYVLSFVLNFVLLLQCYIYRENTRFTVINDIVVKES
mmetsp:Transcript_11459/g.14722  ORF Transcript_11459/g.14722 Transcript_11459/m.14722 type:complete len:243 (-) Transcript_11459:308-1036(-)